MKLLKSALLVALLIFSCLSQAQEALSNEEAIKKYHELRQVVKSKKFKFSDETYWPYYFEIENLLDEIVDDHELVLYHHYISAYNFRYYGLTKQSIKCYKEVLKYYDEHESSFTAQEKVDFNHYRTQSYGYLADEYAKASYLDSANMTHKKNIQFTRNLKNINRASALNNYGLFLYWQKKELDSALVYFNESFALTKSITPTDLLLGSIRDNIADIYVEQGKIAEANSLYHENFIFYKTAEVLGPKGIGIRGLDARRFIAAGVQLIDTAISLGQIEHIEYTLSQMQEFLDEKKFEASLLPISRLPYLQAKERVFMAQNRSQEAYKIAKVVKQLSDSLEKSNSKRKTVIKENFSEAIFQRLKIQHIIEKQQKESKIKNQRLKLWIITLTAIFVIILLTSLFLRRRQHITNAKNKQLIAEQDLELTTLRNEQLNQEIVSKQRDLSDFAINLTQSQEWAKTIASKLEYLKTTDGNARKDLFNDLEADIKNKVTFDKETKVFYQRLDKLSDSFYSELNTQFPKLSKNEIRLCSLIRLKMDSRSIATLQNISLASLNTSRYRLRKKLNLSEDVDLDVFIQNI